MHNAKTIKGNIVLPTEVLFDSYLTFHDGKIVSILDEATPAARPSAAGAAARAGRGRSRRAASRRPRGRRGGGRSRCADAEQVDAPGRGRRGARAAARTSARRAGSAARVRCGNSRPSWNT